MPDQIGLDQWNRTFLQRQHLLERVDDDAVEVLDRIVGIQSQDPRAAFFGLWSRVADFDPAELDGLLTEREVIRIALLRSTVFLVDGEDARWLRPLAQPIIDTEARRNHASTFIRADADDVARAARDLLDGQTRSGADLGALLAEQFVDENPSTLTAVARCLLPLVQVPPRGLWNGRGAPTYALLDDWIGPGEPAVRADEARKDLVRLYLRGFGPSTVKGIQSWSGLTRLRPIVTAMEKDWELVIRTGPHGEELFDLDGLALADPDEPAPVRLLAPYDNAIVSQADRIRIADTDIYRSTLTANGRFPGFVLVDGRLAGIWSLDGDGRVIVDYRAEVSPRARREVDAEVERLQEFCDR
ncbi:winged helix DNA-binding domain-containing protein [Gordonia soli]|uniref:Winged helix DNA-binding domain-containing protein n=1 Tax=Gordonia soli NBRC 108243 TaxID=1223545 RepID=M0QLY4_9ACTN|nr:winged helix DNA-binding domain-containing protein [Gordonia soli]GAC69311.1 hypothetical protein GS4_23_01080 [Gordonia soli NBRC 108243]